MLGKTRIFLLLALAGAASACASASDSSDDSAELSSGKTSGVGSGAGSSTGGTAAVNGSSQGSLKSDGDSFSSGAGGSGAVNTVVIGSGGGNGVNSPVIIDPTLPEESEAPSFRAPVVTGNYLWSTNPESGKVALIDASNLSTRVLSAGLLPTHLRAVPSDDYVAAAIVLNIGTSDASFFRVDDTVTTTRIDVHVGANQWAISESGRWAVAWSESGTGEHDPTEGLQEVTVMDLSQETPLPRRVTVGYRPELVTFDEGEEELIVVSKQGVSLLELGTDTLRWVSLSEGVGREVSITQEGEHALVRQSGSNQIEIVSLDGSDEFSILELPGVITDLDITNQGRAIAVVRDAAMVVLFDANEAIESEDAVDRVFIEGEIVGSVVVSDNGERAVLYTTAGDTKRVTILNLKEGDGYLEYRSLDTQTAVQSVIVSPGGDYAISVGQGAMGVGTGSFALLSLDAERFSRVVGTDAPVKHVFLGDEAGVVTATSSVAQIHEAHIVSLSGLHVETVPLASAPLSAGLLDDLSLGFAAQDHPEGRVTFFEFGAADARTLTGFELSSEIVEE